MRYILKTRNDYYVESVGISNSDINKAKRFKTKKEAQNYLEQIQNSAEWMVNFKCEIMEVQSE